MGVEKLPNCDEKSKLVIFLLADKPKYTTRFSTTKINFNKHLDIIDICDLISHINKLDPLKITQIKEYLEYNLDAIDGGEKTICSENETIIRIVEYLSNSTEVLNEIESIIDPDNKINNRFSRYAETIKDEYKDYYLAYGISLNTVYNSLIDDRVKQIKHDRYLKTISIKALDKNQNNPLLALDYLVKKVNDLISLNGKKYDKGAIRFYLIDQIIRCNVFPNEVKK